MAKNGKRKNSALTIPTILLVIIGFFGFFFRPLNGIEALQLVSDGTAMLVQIIGAVLLMAGLVLMYFYFNSVVENDAELKISEADERYNAVRGKAAQLSSLVGSYLSVALILAFIILDYSMPAILLGLAVVVNSYVNMAAVNHYDKKM